MRARAHARVVVSRDASCGLCRFVVRTGAVGYMVVSSVPASASRLFVCADCHDDCHAEFGGLPARVARVIVADYALFAEPVDFTGLALVVGFPDGVPGLGAAARRLAYEFSSDFPLALRLDVTDRGHVPGAVEAFLHVRPERLTPHVLYAVVEAALIVLQAGRVEGTARCAVPVGVFVWPSRATSGSGTFGLSSSWRLPLASTRMTSLAGMLSRFLMGFASCFSG